MIVAIMPAIIRADRRFLPADDITFDPKP